MMALKQKELIVMVNERIATFLGLRICCLVGYLIPNIVYTYI